MTEAFATNLGSHLGRHLLYWAITQSDFWYFADRCADLVNKFHDPLERGVQVLDHLLTLEEEEVAYGGGGNQQHPQPEQQWELHRHPHVQIFRENRQVIRNVIVEDEEDYHMERNRRSKI